MKRLRIHVKAKAATAIRSRHPWVFSDSIQTQNQEGSTGDLAFLYDPKDQFLGIGLYDSNSPIRVRVLHVGKPIQIDQAWWKNRFDSAISKRTDFFGPLTTGYRLIHGENDGWPGLVLDRYDHVCVMKIYTAAWFPMMQQMLSLIPEQLTWCRSIVLRLSRNIQVAAKNYQTPFQDGDVIHGEKIRDRIVFLENGIKFEADVLKGQKTGFFLDQRENRQRVEGLSSKRRVLNAFSFSGAFSLYAARGGASSVADIDISQHALDSSKRNFELNANDRRISECKHALIQADVFEWFKEGDGKEKFDFIIVDPPSLAKTETDRKGAIQAYGKLAQGAIKRLDRSGILLAASCSAHVSADEFFNEVILVAKASGRAFSELERTRHPMDHPAIYREAEYLKGIYLKFNP